MPSGKPHPSVEALRGRIDMAAWYSPDEVRELVGADPADPAAAERSGLAWLAGWFAPEALDDPQPADMELRYRATDQLGHNPSARQRLRAAFAALRDPGPFDLVNGLEGVTLTLVEIGAPDGGGAATLAFAPGLEATNNLGPYATAEAQAQFIAMLRHYLAGPHAGELAGTRAVRITVDGRAQPLFGDDAWTRPVPLA